MTVSYDDVKDITGMSLAIKSATGPASAVTHAIYANGRNQLAIEIIAKATAGTRILHFSGLTWLSITKLLDASNNSLLTEDGTSGWCYTTAPNDYCREIEGATFSGNAGTPTVRTAGSGETIITLYAYAHDAVDIHIAVGIEIDGKIAYSTTDASTGVEQNYLQATAKDAIIYSTDNITIERSDDLGGTTVNVREKQTNQTTLESTINDYSISAHYINIYITSGRYPIQSYTVHVDKNDKALVPGIAKYWTNHNNQYLLVVNPKTASEEKSTTGFYGKAEWSESGFPGFDYIGYSIVYSLFLTFSYNDRPNAVCCTQLVFNASEHWPLPDKLGLKQSLTATTGEDISDKGEYDSDSYFDFYDNYGNHGSFTIRRDASKNELVIEQKR